MKNSYGKYLHGTKALFICDTGREIGLCQSFCQDGNWSKVLPIKVININYLIIPYYAVKTCEFSPSSTKKNKSYSNGR